MIDIDNGKSQDKDISDTTEGNSQMGSITLITVNENEKYNTIQIDTNDQGLVEEIADALNNGESVYEDTSGMTEVDLEDGCEYGKVYVDIPEDHPRYEEIKEIIECAGSYLDEMDPRNIDYDESGDEHED